MQRNLVSERKKEKKGGWEEKKKQKEREFKSFPQLYSKFLTSLRAASELLPYQKKKKDFGDFKSYIV